MKKFLIFLLCITVFMTSISFVSAATSDISGHWAQSQLQDWVSKGLLKGYSDGTVKPNNNMSRIEFAALVNRIFHFENSTDMHIKDIKTGSWAYKEAAAAINAGYMKGGSDGSFRPSDKITRAEAAVILARLLKLDSTKSTGYAYTYKDYYKIAGWSLKEVEAMAYFGYMKGTPDGNFNPLSPLTRAEAVVLLDRATVNSNNYAVDLGMSKAEVIKTLGTPTSVDDMNYASPIYYYASKRKVPSDEAGKYYIVTNTNAVYFQEIDGVVQVVGWKNDGNLRVKQLALSNEPVQVSVGTAKEDVIKAYGLPQTLLKLSTYEQWFYNGSYFYIEDGKVSGWQNAADMTLVNLGSKQQDAQPFALGSTQDEVLKANGNPSFVDFSKYSSGAVWKYGESTVGLDRSTGLVNWVVNKGELNFSVGDKTADAPAITLGSTEAQVAAAAGTPIEAGRSTGYYNWIYSYEGNRTWIEFKDGLVVGWKNTSGLNINLGEKQPDATTIAIGSSKEDVVKVYGTPYSIDEPSAGFITWVYLQGNNATYIMFDKNYLVRSIN